MTGIFSICRRSPGFESQPAAPRVLMQDFLNGCIMVIGMNIKPDPNHKIYLEILRQVPPEQRLRTAFNLSECSKQFFYQGLRNRFPDLSQAELKKLFLERLDKCHNRNY